MAREKIYLLPFLSLVMSVRSFESVLLSNVSFQRFVVELLYCPGGCCMSFAQQFDARISTVIRCCTSYNYYNYYLEKEHFTSALVVADHNLEVKREYYQNSSVLDCVTQCSQSAAHLCEQFLQVKQIGFVTLGSLCCAKRRLPRVVLL